MFCASVRCRSRRAVRNASSPLRSRAVDDRFTRAERTPCAPEPGLFDNWLPDDTVEAFKEFLVGIKGPLTTPVGGGIRSLNVALRQVLDLYCCVRPVKASVIANASKIEHELFLPPPRLYTSATRGALQKA